METNKFDPIQYTLKKMQFLEQFAQTVVDYSSRYNSSLSTSYAPINLIGNPTRYPQYGDFPETYSLRSYGKWWNESAAAQPNYMPQDRDHIISEDYIILRFRIAVIPTNIIIYETYNPGAVVRLYGRKTPNRWHLLYESPPDKCPTVARRFAPEIRPHYDLINEVRIEFNQSDLEYHTSLDAVILAGYEPRSLLQFHVLKLSELDVQRHKPAIKSPSQHDDKSHETMGVDYFNKLPYEVIVHIFQYLDLKSLLRCAQVCKRWYEASLDSTIYQALSLKKYWSKVDNKTLKYLKYRCKILKKMDISWCGSEGAISEDVFREFIKNYFEHITHLSVGNCDFIQNVAMGHIGKCTELIDLRLRNCFPKPWTFSFLQYLNKLVVLDLCATEIGDENLIKILKANPNLKHLILDLCEELRHFDQITETLAIYNAKLMSLSCWKTVSLSADGVKHLGRCTQLRELDMGWCLLTTDPGDCLESIALGCKDLKRLILSNWRGLNDHHLLPIIRSCKQLTQLDLLGIKNITGDICECALASLPKLQLLEVSYCGNIQTSQVNNWRTSYPNATIQNCRSSSD